MAYTANQHSYNPTTSCDEQTLEVRQSPRLEASRAEDDQLKEK